MQLLNLHVGKQALWKMHRCEIKSISNAEDASQNMDGV